MKQDIVLYAVEGLLQIVQSLGSLVIVRACARTQLS